MVDVVFGAVSKTVKAPTWFDPTVVPLKVNPETFVALPAAIVVVPIDPVVLLPLLALKTKSLAAALFDIPTRKFVLPPVITALVEAKLVVSVPRAFALNCR